MAFFFGSRAQTLACLAGVLALIGDRAVAVSPLRGHLSLLQQGLATGQKVRQNATASAIGNGVADHELETRTVDMINVALQQKAERRRQQLIREGTLGVTSEVSNVNFNIMNDLETPSSVGETFMKMFDVKQAADLDHLHTAVAEALQHDYSIVRFKSPAWRVETDVDGVDIPYIDQFKQVDATHGEYKPTDSVIMISPTASSVLQDMDWADDKVPSLLGFGKKAQRKLQPEEVAASKAAKHLVLYMNFGTCLYFAHALANILPRASSVLQGARAAGYKVSAVVPPSGRGYFSKNTELMLNEMGVDLLSEGPATPHQTALVSQVASWSPYMKQLMQKELRRKMMENVQAKDCSQHPPRSGIFLSRAHGANNGRWQEGSEHLEEEFKDLGFEIKDDIRDIPVQELARDLYQNHCTLAGFAGGNLLNLMFLPDKARVVEYNPSRIYADRWLFAKALGLDFIHTVPEAGAMTEAKAEQLAQLAFRPGDLEASSSGAATDIVKSG